MALLDVFADLQFGPLTSAQRTSASYNGDYRIYELAVLSGKSSDTSCLSFGSFASLRPSAAKNGVVTLTCLRASSRTFELFGVPSHYSPSACKKLQQTTPLVPMTLGKRNFQHNWRIPQDLDSQLQPACSSSGVRYPERLVGATFLDMGFKCIAKPNIAPIPTINKAAPRLNIKTIAVASRA